MATKIRETESYQLWKDDDGTFGASLVGGVSYAVTGCASELEAVERLLITQRDLVNQRNDEQRALRRALPQFWLGDMWKEPSPLTVDADSGTTTG